MKLEWPKTTRTAVADTIAGAAEALGKTSTAVAVIVAVAVLALILATVALVRTLKG